MWCPCCSKPATHYRISSAPTCYVQCGVYRVDHFGNHCTTAPRFVGSPSLVDELVAGKLANMYGNGRYRKIVTLTIASIVASAVASA